MNAISPITSLVLVALLTGCAAKAPQELVDARMANAKANEGQARTLVPAELHKADEALADAEAAFEDDPRGYHTADLAYVAHRKAQLAQALAMQAAQVERTKDAEKQYQVGQDALMRSAVSDLATAETRLEVSEEARATSEAGRLASERKMAEAMAALTRLAEVKEEPRGVVITLSGGVLFASDQATLLPEAQTRLADVTSALLAASDRTILIEGHTDSQGSDAYNLELSQRRAEAVRTYMGQRGYDISRTRAVGIGEARPVASNDTDEGRANNRRVEVVIEPTKTASSK